MESVRRVYPEDIAPPGFLDRDPDTAQAFAPAGDGTSENPAAGPSPIEEGESAGRVAGEPEPAPARPEVTYQGVGGVATYTLLFPVKIAGRMLRRVTIHPPALWDIQDWAAGRLATNYDLTARMLDMDPIALGALRWPDIQAILDIATPMLPGALREAIEMSTQAARRTETDG